MRDHNPRFSGRPGGRPGSRPGNHRGGRFGAKGFPPRPNQNFRREIRMMVAEAPDGMTTAQICDRLKVVPQQIGDDIEVLIQNDNLIGFAGLWFAPDRYRELAMQFLAAALEVHAKHSNQPGIRPEAVATHAGLPWKGKTLDRIVVDLVERKRLELHEGLIRHPDFHPSLPARQRELLDRVLVELRTEPINVPSPHDIARILGVPHQAVTTIMNVGVAAGELVFIVENVFYAIDQLEAACNRVLAMTNQRACTAGEIREALATTRKYVPALLEYMESEGMLMRRDDRWLTPNRPHSGPSKPK